MEEKKPEVEVTIKLAEIKKEKAEISKTEDVIRHEEKKL